MILGFARAGHVRWHSAALFAVVGVGGAVAGSQLGKAVDGHRLLVLFGILMVVVGALMLRPRAEGTAPRTTFAMTGHDDPRTRRRCLDAGCRDVLVKPVPARELLRLVDEAAASSAA